MEDFKTLLTNPYTYSGLGVAAILGVWFAKMNPATANLTLVIGIVFFAVSVFLLPLVSTNPISVRILWAVAVASCLGLLCYYTLWTKFTPISLFATTSAASKPKGEIIGGINWLKHYTEIRIVLSNKSKHDFESIDIVFKPDQPITKGGVVTNINGTTLVFDSLPTISPEFVNKTDGSRESIPIVPLASTIGFRLRCEKLPRHSSLEIVLAAVSVKDGHAQKDVDKLFAINFKGGSTAWFAHKNHTFAVFGKRPDVKDMSVKGQYIVAGRQHNIEETIDIKDLMKDIVPKILKGDLK